MPPVTLHKFFDDLRLIHEKYADVIQPGQRQRLLQELLHSISLILLIGTCYGKGFDQKMADDCLGQQIISIHVLKTTFYRLRCITCNIIGGVSGIQSRNAEVLDYAISEYQDGKRQEGFKGQEDNHELLPWYVNYRNLCPEKDYIRKELDRIGKAISTRELARGVRERERKGWITHRTGNGIFRG